MGRGAVLIDAGGRRPAAVADALRSLPGLVDVVVGAETVLVVAGDPAVLARAVAAAADVDADQGGERSGPLVEIPVVYDGPDLAEVASLTGLSEAEVVEAHAGARYEVAFVGFAPGFGYLAGLPDVLRLPRRAQPRSSVPAGAVAIADVFSAVYPRSTPGGWHLLGHTDEVLFDAERTPPALLGPGHRVRFVPSRAGRAGSRPTTEDRMDGAPAGGEPVVKVVDGGGLTTVQDAGRPGRGAEGVPPSGAADRSSARLANRLVGNDEGAAVLETTLAGPTLELGDGPIRTVAVTGGPGPVSVDGAVQAPDAPFDLRPGQVLRVGPPTRGLRRYLALSGGLVPPPVLGSRSTDALTGLGPPPLRPGLLLALGPDQGRRGGVDVAPVRPRPDVVRLRVTPGPQADWLTPSGVQALHAGRWVVDPTSNRVGVRLAGPALERAQTGEVPSFGLVVGAVQLTPSGQLVVFGPDHPVTGGYPVVAVVDPDDLDLVAQLRPGEGVGLEAG